MNNYPKYQYSRFDAKQGQYVVRADEILEFDRLVQEVNAKIDSLPPKEPRQPYKENAGVTVDQGVDKHICAVHGVQKIEKMSKRTNKPYWSHSDKIEGKFIICFGKGFAK